MLGLYQLYNFTDVFPDIMTNLIYRKVIGICTKGVFNFFGNEFQTGKCCFLPSHQRS